MAKFGFSIGDIALLSTYAYKVYKSCQNAGESFAVITADGRIQDALRIEKMMLLKHGV